MNLAYEATPEFNSASVPLAPLRLSRADYTYSHTNKARMGGEQRDDRVSSMQRQLHFQQPTAPLSPMRPGCLRRVFTDQVSTGAAGAQLQLARAHLHGL